MFICEFCKSLCNYFSLSAVQKKNIVTILDVFEAVGDEKTQGNKGTSESISYFGCRESQTHVDNVTSRASRFLCKISQLQFCFSAIMSRSKLLQDGSFASQNHKIHHIGKDPQVTLQHGSSPDADGILFPLEIQCCSMHCHLSLILLGYSIVAKIIWAGEEILTETGNFTLKHINLDISPRTKFLKKKILVLYLLLNVTFQWQLFCTFSL